MGRILLALATIGALAGAGVLAMEIGSNAAPAETEVLHPQRIVIGLDLSRSNPLIADPEFAARVADRIAEQVRQLGFASEVHIRTFGNYDPNSNTFAYDTVLSVRARPEAVAAEVRRLIAGTPYLVRSGKWRAQQNTNILAFLDNVSRAIGCQGMPTTVILASDGIEDSSYAKLDRGDSLPMPEAPSFQGCREFDIFGLGQGTGSPRMTTRLRSEWSRWARAAGFERFQGLNDW
ncbi:MAG: hypothetical protein KGJ78_04530 [Alphaproteobacteria bacterium]|nr:hypothetical protein [Alphaproteobacteria bacterium]